MDKYAQYIKEKYGDELIDHEHGFITFEISGEHVFIKDLWIHPDHRLEGVGRSLADKVVGIGRDSGCKFLCTAVVKRANNLKASLEANLCYGLLVTNEDEERIYLMKEI